MAVHPRVRGDNGKHLHLQLDVPRSTPAYAGTTLTKVPGEWRTYGPPPRTRGQLLLAVRDTEVRRSTPAYAGTTSTC